ncbi:uncharacterized protein LOC102913384 [Peromyscus maniculatus bairdii]|uniref:uncharacterized protein LOC102913384 n=1 Tax=Peromyscus maniculatus bairdii TaxID=230844 RepID=UPI003FD68108
MCCLTSLKLAPEVRFPHRPKHKMETITGNHNGTQCRNKPVGHGETSTNVHIYITAPVSLVRGNVRYTMESRGQGSNRLDGCLNGCIYLLSSDVLLSRCSYLVSSLGMAGVQLNGG